jgi:hypothetical protein
MFAFCLWSSITGDGVLGVTKMMGYDRRNDALPLIFFLTNYIIPFSISESSDL